MLNAELPSTRSEAAGAIIGMTVGGGLAVWGANGPLFNESQIGSRSAELARLQTSIDGYRAAKTVFIHEPISLRLRTDAALDHAIESAEAGQRTIEHASTYDVAQTLGSFSLGILEVVVCGAVAVGFVRRLSQRSEQRSIAA